MDSTWIQNYTAHLDEISTSKHFYAFDLSFIHRILIEEPNSTLDEQLLLQILRKLMNLLKICKLFKIELDVAFAICAIISKMERFEGKTPFQIITQVIALDRWYRRDIPNLEMLIIYGTVALLKVSEAPRSKYNMESMILKLPTEFDKVDALKLKITHCYTELVQMTVKSNKVEKKLLDLNVFYETILIVVIVSWDTKLPHVKNVPEDMLKIIVEMDLENVVDLTTLKEKFTYKAVSNISWSMKHKYVFVKEILSWLRSTELMSKLFDHLDIFGGLLASLENGSTLSSGEILLKFILKSFQDDQIDMILDVLIFRITHAGNRTVEENFAKHWIWVIMKEKPKIWKSLYDKCYESSNINVGMIRSVLTIMKKSKQKGRFIGHLENYEEMIDNFIKPIFVLRDNLKREIFPVLCTSSKNTEIPELYELEVIREFLSENINTDCPLLRQNMLSSFTDLILRIRCSSLSNLKKTNSINENNANFLKWLNELIISNLQPACNYQRKVTSLNLYKIVLSYFMDSEEMKENKKNKEKQENEENKENAKNKGNMRKCNLNGKGQKFVSHLKENWNFTSSNNCKALLTCLLDPCMEIKQLSFQLLIKYFNYESIKNYDLKEIALNLLNNHLFFNMESGSFFMKVILKLKNDDHHDEEIDFLKYAKNQIVPLKTDLFKTAIENPLYGYLKVINFLCNDLEKYENVDEIIKLLENIVQILIKAMCANRESPEDYAPSFAEMGMAIDDVLGIDEEEHENQIHLTDSQQLILNFIWLNMKECCSIAENLICKRKVVDKYAIRCADVIIMVLRRTRHKGAIEAAGMSLSSIVREFTTIKSEDRRQWLCATLHDVLELLILQFGGAISRKSGGHSILIQNMIANDLSGENILLDNCLLTLFEVLNSNFEKLSCVTLMELPQTHALHYLKVLVSDCRLQSSLSPHLERIAVICLKTIGCPLWTIRNASLQLFGSLLPRIVGQKKGGNSGKITKSFEELQWRFPKLFKEILEMLKKAISCEDRLKRIKLQSNIVPVLIIFQQVTTWGNTFLKFKIELTKFRYCFEKLLSSEINYVRKLASVAFINLLAPSDLTRKMVEIKRKICCEHSITKENELNGYLLVIKEALTKYPKKFKFEKVVDKFQNRSFINRKLLIETDFVKMQNFNANEFNKLIKCNKNIGFNSFFNKIVKNNKSIILRTSNYRFIIKCDIKYKYQLNQVFKNNLINADIILTKLVIKVIVQQNNNNINSSELLKHCMKIVKNYERYDAENLLAFSILIHNEFYVDNKVIKPVKNDDYSDKKNIRKSNTKMTSTCRNNLQIKNQCNEFNRNREKNNINEINGIDKIDKNYAIRKINENHEINGIGKTDENHEINKTDKNNEINGIDKNYKTNKINKNNKIGKINKGKETNQTIKCNEFNEIKKIKEIVEIYKNKEKLIELLLEEMSLIDIYKCNKDVKINVLKCINKISCQLNYKDKLIWNILLALLQDDDVDVRNEASLCLTNNNNDDDDDYDVASLKNMFKLKTLEMFIPKHDILSNLWNLLNIDDNVDVDIKIENSVHNPFMQGIVDTEQVLIIDYALSALKVIIKTEDNEYYIKRYRNKNYVKLIETLDFVYKKSFMLSANEYILVKKCYAILSCFVMIKIENYELYDILLNNLKDKFCFYF